MKAYRISTYKEHGYHTFLIEAIDQKSTYHLERTFVRFQGNSAEDHWYGMKYVFEGSSLEQMSKSRKFFKIFEAMNVDKYNVNMEEVLEKLKNAGYKRVVYDPRTSGFEFVHKLPKGIQWRCLKSDGEGGYFAVVCENEGDVPKTAFEWAKKTPNGQHYYDKWLKDGQKVAKGCQETPNIELPSLKPGN